MNKREQQVLSEISSKMKAMSAEMNYVLAPVHKAPALAAADELRELVEQQHALLRNKWAIDKQFGPVFEELSRIGGYVQLICDGVKLDFSTIRTAELQAAVFLVAIDGKFDSAWQNGKTRKFEHVQRFMRRVESNMLPSGQRRTFVQFSRFWTTVSGFLEHICFVAQDVQVVLNQGQGDG